MSASPMPAGAVPLASLAAWQAGSVVSRTLVKKEKGTVTLFAFDAGQGLSEHTAPFDALVLALEGRGTVVLGGTPHSLAPGDALLMPAGTPHALTALQPFRMLLVMIRE